MSDRIRSSKEAVPTQSMLVLPGVLIGFLSIMACMLARLGINLGLLLLQPQHTLASLGPTGLSILIASSLSVPMLMLAGVGSVRTLRHLQQHRELKTQGVTTQGYIVDRWKAWFSFYRPYRFWRYIVYGYADGHTAKQPIPLRLYKHAQIGTPVTVRYLEHDPSISRVELVDDKWQVR